jgi:hypothetical protein
MQAFSVFLNSLNEGAPHAAITADMATLLQAVQNSGKGGALAIVVKVQPAVKGTGGADRITITVDRKLTLPKHEVPSDFFYLTDDAEPVRNHPRQQTLELRDTAAQPPVSFKTAT